MQVSRGPEWKRVKVIDDIHIHAAVTGGCQRGAVDAAAAETAVSDGCQQQGSVNDGLPIQFYF